MAAAAAAASSTTANVAKYQYDMTQNGAYSSDGGGGGGGSGGGGHAMRTGGAQGLDAKVWAVAISQPIKSMFSNTGIGISSFA